jgi:hypothetical protein
MSKKDYDDDDGRVVSDMRLTEQLHWYDSFSSDRDKKKKGLKKQSLAEANIVLSKGETKSYIFSALLAGLTIALVFIGSFYLFILFCIYIWFQ